MSVTCEICDKEDGSRISVREFETVPNIGWHIEVGGDALQVKKVLLRPAPSRTNAVWDDTYSVVIFV